MSLRDDFEKHVEATSVCWVEEMRSRLFARSANGGYYEWSGLESRFQDFAAGHAAGLEAAAAECDKQEKSLYSTLNGNSDAIPSSIGAGICAAAIRAMKP